jgi:hypothetical protein
MIAEMRRATWRGLEGRFVVVRPLAAYGTGPDKSDLPAVATARVAQIAASTVAPTSAPAEEE